MIEYRCDEVKVKYLSAIKYEPAVPKVIFSNLVRVKGCRALKVNLCVLFKYEKEPM